MTTVELDVGKVEEFGAQMAAFINGGAAALMLSIGHQTGLFDVMAGLPLSTSEQIAERGGSPRALCAGMAGRDGDRGCRRVRQPAAPRMCSRRSMRRSRPERPARTTSPR